MDLQVIPWSFVPEGETKWRGYCIDFIATLADRMNVDYELIVSQDVYMIRRGNETTYGGVMSDLIDGVEYTNYFTRYNGVSEYHRASFAGNRYGSSSIYVDRRKSRIGRFYHPVFRKFGHINGYFSISHSYVALDIVY